MKRFWLYTGLVLSLISILAPITVSAQSALVTNISIEVWLRVGPGTDWRKLGTLPAGTTVALDGRDVTAQWVRGISSDGLVGWMSGDYTNASSDAVAALPVIDREAAVTVSAPGQDAAPAAAPAVAAAEEAVVVEAEAEPVPAAEAVAAPIVTAPIQPIASTAPVSGFSYGGHVDGLNDGVANYMRSAGMTWVKKQVRYSLGSDPNGMAGLISSAHGSGFRILLGVVGSKDQMNTPGYNDQFAAFAAGLAGLGADAIEVWNEPNIDREWPIGQIDPVAYTNMLASAYNAIKAANPNTLVISGAPAPTGFFGGCSGIGCDDAPFISGMAAAGAARYMDCLGIHYNEGIVGPAQTSGDPRSEYFTRYFWGMVNTYDAAFGGQRPLCFTELGYLTPEGFPPLPGGFAWAQNVTLAQQAQWLGQVVDYARASGRVRLLIVWNVNFSFYGDDPMAGYAIIRPDGSCPACAAMAN